MNGARVVSTRSSARSRNTLSPMPQPIFGVGADLAIEERLLKAVAWMDGRAVPEAPLVGVRGEASNTLTREDAGQRDEVVVAEAKDDGRVGHGWSEFSVRNSESAVGEIMV